MVVKLDATKVENVQQETNLNKNFRENASSILGGINYFLFSSLP